MRNVQMGVFSIPAALLGTFLQDGSNIKEKGFLYGFDAVVWFTAFWYGIGGLSVAVCIKYADNIAKNFATSVAIILATLGSIYIFNFQPNLMFVAGASLVIASIFLYSSSSVVNTRMRPSKA
jgi:UDP-sugar transporter A1/2/3